MTEFFLFGGEERPVMFGQHAYREFEKMTGISLLIPKVTDNMGTYEAMHAIVYVGLKWGMYKSDGIEPKPKFTLIQVGDWCAANDEVTAKIVSKFQESYLADRTKKAGAGENPA